MDMFAWDFPLAQLRPWELAVVLGSFMGPSLLLLLLHLPHMTTVQLLIPCSAQALPIISLTCLILFCACLLEDAKWHTPPAQQALPVRIVRVSVSEVVPCRVHEGVHCVCLSPGCSFAPEKSMRFSKWFHLKYNTVPPAFEKAVTMSMNLKCHKNNTTLWKDNSETARFLNCMVHDVLQKFTKCKS
jgi:hypothetical protein